MIEIRLLALVGLIVTAVVSVGVAAAMAALLDWARRVVRPPIGRSMAALRARMKA